MIAWANVYQLHSVTHGYSAPNLFIVVSKAKSYQLLCPVLWGKRHSISFTLRGCLLQRAANQQNFSSFVLDMLRSKENGSSDVD
jgi:hypothetical protein